MHREPAPGILLVEGNCVGPGTLRKLLEEEGFPLRTATDGAAAMKILEAERPGLILLDLLLPDTDGLRLARQIAESSGNGSVPIVVLTCENCNGEVPPEVRSLPSVRRFLYQPCRPKTILEEIRSLLRVSGRAAQRTA